MKLTIINNPKNWQTVKAVDEAKNHYSYSPVTNVVTVTTPDGFIVASETAKDALVGAEEQREAARTSWTPQPVKVKFPPNSTSEDAQYWSDRASEIEGRPIVLSPKV